MIRYRSRVLTAVLVFAALALVIMHHAHDTAPNISQLLDYSIQAKANDINGGDTGLEADEVSDNDDYDDRLVRVKREVPLIWIGGVPRSGTTLMR